MPVPLLYNIYKYVYRHTLKNVTHMQRYKKMQINRGSITME